MHYGQADRLDPEAQADHRGIVPMDIAREIRKVRIAEEWIRYDSICVGQGAGRVSGWFDTWQDFAAADSIRWFGGRQGAGKAFTNQSAERNDFAQDIRYYKCEFIAPVGLSSLESDGNDGFTLPLIFSQLLPTMLHMSVVMSDTDEILSLPASEMTTGTPGIEIDGAGSPTVLTKTSGGNNARNGFFWPEPVMVAAKSRMTFEGRLDRPIRDMLLALAGPGNKDMAKGDGSGDIVVFPNWYQIKMYCGGPRVVQPRGARSSA